MLPRYIFIRKLLRLPDRIELRKRMKKIRTPIVLAFLALVMLLSACTGGSSINSWPGLSVDNSNAYLAYSQYVYKIHLNDGSMEWRVPEKGGTGFYTPPALTSDGQMIVGGVDKSLYSFNATNGSQNWTFKAGDRWIAGALVDGQSLYAADTDHSLYKFDLKGQKVWAFSASSLLWAKPLKDKDTLYLSSMDHHLYAINANTGTQIWRSDDLGGSVLGTPALSQDGVLYIGTLGNELLAIDSSNGKVLWKYATSGGVWGGPVLVGTTLYFGDMKGTFYIFDATTHKPITQAEPGGAILGSPFVTKDTIFFGTETGSAVAMDLTGKILWNHSINGKLYTTPVQAGDRILFAITQGDQQQLLVAMDKNGNQNWVFTQPK